MGIVAKVGGLAKYNAEVSKHFGLTQKPKKSRIMQKITKMNFFS